MRTKIVVVAVLRDENGNYLVTQHPRWDGYSFPMNDVEHREQATGLVAIQAIEQDLGIRLPDATAEELEFLVNAGISESTDELTSYDFHLFEVRSSTLSNPHSLTGTLSSPLFLSKQEILSRQDITWSTRQLIQEFTTFSDVVVTVITRPGPYGTELFLVWSSYWDGYFLPSQRCGSDATHSAVVKKTLRDDLGYLGGVQIEKLLEDFASGISSRFGMDHHYMLYLYRAELEGKPCDAWSRRKLESDKKPLPVTQFYSRLGDFEHRLKSLGKKYTWAPLSQIQQFAIAIPPKAERILKSIQTTIIDQKLPDSVAIYRGAVGVVKHTSEDGLRFLTIWDPINQQLSFLGGECLSGETPTDCLKRHLSHQLGLKAGWLKTDPEETGTYYDYVRVRHPEEQLTHFKLTVVNIGFSDEAIEQSLLRGTDFRWVSSQEVRNQVCNNGPRIDPLLNDLLSDAELLSDPIPSTIKYTS